MRAFVTGATGFLGHHLCRALIERGDFVAGLERDLHSHRVVPCSVLAPGDIESFDGIARILSEYEIDTVFHLAAQAQVSVAKADPLGTFRSNIAGTWNVLEACRQQKARRVIVASSDKVYGNNPCPYHEFQQLHASGPYGTSKVCEDLLAQSYAQTYGMSIAITRCSNLYGPGHTNWSTLIPGTIKSVIEGKPPILRSDGKAKRDYLYVGDAVDGYLRLADSDYVGPMNFGTGKPNAAFEVAQLICELLGSSLAPVIENSAVGEIDSQWLNSDKAREELGWSAMCDLRYGLSLTIPWYVEHSRSSDETRRVDAGA